MQTHGATKASPDHMHVHVNANWGQKKVHELDMNGRIASMSEEVTAGRTVTKKKLFHMLCVLARWVSHAFAHPTHRGYRFLWPSCINLSISTPLNAQPNEWGQEKSSTSATPTHRPPITATINTATAPIQPHQFSSSAH